MPEKAVFTHADVAAIHDKNAQAPTDLAASVAEEMNKMVENGEDPATFNNPESESESVIESEPEVDEVLEQAVANGYDPDYEGDNPKTPEEFNAYSDKVSEEKARKVQDRATQSRLDKLEGERAVLAETDASNLRQKLVDLTSLHKDAVEEADYDQVTSIQKQMDETRVKLHNVNSLAKPPPVSKGPAAIDEGAQTLINDFEAKNKWIQNKDEADTQYAQFIFNKTLGNSQLNDQSERVEEAIDAVKAAIPHRFKSTNKARSQAASSLKGKGRTLKASQVTERDLSSEELKAFKSFKRAGVYKTPGEYYKDMVEGVKK